MALEPWQVTASQGLSPPDTPQSGDGDVGAYLQRAGLSDRNEPGSSRGWWRAHEGIREFTTDFQGSGE